MKLIKQVSCIHTLAMVGLLMTCAKSIIDNCINNIGKHIIKYAEMRKRGRVESVLGQKVVGRLPDLRQWP